MESYEILCNFLSRKNFRIRLKFLYAIYFVNINVIEKQ